MKKQRVAILLLLLVLNLSACAGIRVPAMPQETAASEAASAQPKQEPESMETKIPVEEENTVMQMKIADTLVAVEWENNESVDALRALTEAEPLTIPMSMYGGFEQVGPIGQRLPRDDVQTTTSAGDLVLYAGNQLVVFYGSNSWAYTRLGHITDKTAAEMAALLGNGDVTITIGKGLSA